MGMLQEEIRIGGRWVHGVGKMQQFYLSNYPIPFAFGMAGFREKSLHLKRNEVSPPMELQQEIFPFIETAFGEPGTEDREEWQKTCVDEMNEKKQNDSSQLQDVLPLQSTTTQEAGVPPAHTVHLDVAKRSFLKLLLRQRRVILQDAAVYMYGNLKLPILHHDAFASPTFLRFKQNVETALQRKDDALPADIPRSMIQAMTSHQQQEARRFNNFQDILQQVQLQQKQQQQQFAEWICQLLERQGAVMQNMFNDLYASINFQRLNFIPPWHRYQEQLSMQTLPQAMGYHQPRPALATVAAMTNPPYSCSRSRVLPPPPRPRPAAAGIPRSAPMPAPALNHRSTGISSNDLSYCTRSKSDD
ncbi:hypothetical protein EDD21DRAFT_359975 [Dissophora ornata]|nr:hypothetical protein EDD21DRAFT_359975 [Dissophora ornata]